MQISCGKAFWSYRFDMSKSQFLLSLSFICLSLVSGCREATVESTTGKPIIYVPVAPYQEIASRVAGDAFEVRAFVPEAKDPHDYLPTPKEITKVSQAAVFFTGDLPYETGIVEKITAANSKIEVSSLTENIELLEGSEGEHCDGEDHSGHDHAHHDHEFDPHLWLSPKMLKKQAALMADVMKNLKPDSSDQIDANLAKVEGDLDALDKQLAETLAFMKGQTFYVYHGAFAYFAQAYGLKQEAIELGGRSPEPKRLTELVKMAKAEGVKLIFVQPQFNQASAKSLADSIGGQVVEMDPLEQDVFASLKKIADQVKQSSVK